MEFNLDKYHLKSTSLFDFLSAKEAQAFKSSLLRKEYEKGDYLFREKSHPKGVFIIRKGKVKIFQAGSNGKQSIVYIYRKGDFFGYRPLLAGETQPVSAVAMDNVVVSFIPKEIFLSTLSSSATLAKQLLLNLTKEFSVWVNKLTVFSQYGVKERVALSLLILNRVYRINSEKPTSVKIAINRDDLAGFVGTAKETLVRILRVFKDEKLITTQGTKIMIAKPRSLLGYVY